LPAGVSKIINLVAQQKFLKTPETDFEHRMHKISDFSLATIRKFSVIRPNLSFVPDPNKKTESKYVTVEWEY